MVSLAHVVVFCFGFALSHGQDCPLWQMSSSNIRGYKNRPVQVEASFVPHMLNIGKIAKDCQVMVWVMSSFRKSGQTVSGAIVPPAVRSNHLVGHAIDFNLDTKQGWCNSKCLKATNNRDVKCFLDRIKAAGMRWGGNFMTPDTVHIDDGLNLSDPNAWRDLYKKLQTYC